MRASAYRFFFFSVYDLLGFSMSWHIAVFTEDIRI